MNALEQAEAFFYEHAGYAYEPRTETPEHVAEAALARGYGHNAARAIARTYVDHTPTLKETRRNG